MEFEGCASHSFQPALTSPSSGRKVQLKMRRISINLCRTSPCQLCWVSVCVPGYQEVHDVNVKCICDKLFFVNHLGYIVAGMKRLKQHFYVGAAAVGKALESVVQVLLKSVSSQQ